MSFSHTDVLAASRVLRRCDRLLLATGCREEELRLCYPVLLSLESLVYRGDREAEEAERAGTVPGDRTWLAELHDVLEAHGLRDPGVTEELRDFIRYFPLEARLFLGHESATHTRLRELLAMRSADVRLLMRVLWLLTDRPHDELFLRLMRPWLAYEELKEDLASWERDAEEGSFNVPALLVERYGELGHSYLRDLLRKLLAEGHRELARAAPPALLSYLRVLGVRPPGGGAPQERGALLDAVRARLREIPPPRPTRPGPGTKGKPSTAPVRPVR